jgi:hypothetical protein
MASIGGGKREEERAVSAKPSFKTPHAPPYVGEDIMELQTLWQKLVLFHQTASYSAKKT